MPKSKSVLFQLWLAVLALFLLNACIPDTGDQVNADDDNDEPQQTVSVEGAGVKGPLAGAVVRVYQLDLSAADLKGTLLDEGSTGSDAAITGLNIAQGLSGLVLMEFITDADTTDIGTGMAPVIDTLTTVIDVQHI